MIELIGKVKSKGFDILKIKEGYYKWSEREKKSYYKLNDKGIFL